jgi:NarL family two-component system response regulator LiaR
MRRQAILYGSILAVLAICIKWLEYHYLILDYTMEIYGTALAVIFTVLGIAAGRKLTDPKVVREVIKEEIIVEKPVYISDSGLSDRQPKMSPERLGLSTREYEILELMALGYSNQEIAEKTFLSIHTIKTHASNLFVKLDVKRRTQAVSRARELKLID